MPRRAPKLSQAVFTEVERDAIESFSIKEFAPFESVARRSLNAAERKKLNAAAKKYLTTRALEINSPAVSAVEKHLAQVKGAAGALRRALLAKDTASASFFASQALNERLKDRPLSRRIAGQVDSASVALLMRDVERACDKAARSLTGEPEQLPSWVHLVLDLEKWAQAAGLTTTVSKRLQGKTSRLPLSPFVALVKAVQAVFPAAYRQHEQSDDALSTAVSLAKRVV